MRHAQWICAREGMPLISIIVPCYNEKDTLTLFVDEVKRVGKTLADDDIELIFVDDGSTDGTLEAMRGLCAGQTGMRYISFSRNFGKEAAMLAGLKACRGEYAAVMDADLQDPPSLLPEMLKAVKEEGFDWVGTRRVTRKGEPHIRSLCARLFYKFINSISDTQIVDGARDFKLMRRSVVDALVSLQEYNRFSKGLNEWVGFRNKWIEFENVERVAGETKWSFWKLMKYSIEGVVGFTTAPLSLASMLGLTFVVISFAAIVFLVLRQLLWHASVSGWTSLVCIIVFFCGIQLLCLGIIGQYLAKTYLEVKRRPVYIIREESRP
ncbi:MAG: glycosyltransferase family 2 protein [Akkermansia sp.]|nr:glycosyltransferase family 2 protein [Akkermansia sp.]